MIQIREGLTFDDVLLEPVHSNVVSRSDIDLVCGFAESDLAFEHPIIPANMSDVAGVDLLRAQLISGGLAIMHRFQTVDEQIGTFKKLAAETGYGERIAASIGVSEEDWYAARRMIDEGVHVICVDVAHGDHFLAERQVRLLAGLSDHERPDIIAGNVATRGGARLLFEAGADAVKVGIGPGSLCTTRIETGCGVPQLTALMDVWALREEHYPYRMVIADGGIKNAGDCVKALCFSNMVMVGNLFAGCDEAPSEMDRNTSNRVYRGSSTHKTSHVEGVRALVPRAGAYSDVLNRLLEGIRSGCSYQGSHNLYELREDPRLIKITSAGLRESYPHDVELISDES